MLVDSLDVLALDIDGVLTDGRVAIGPGGEISKGIAFRDLDALGKVRRAGLHIALVTGEDGPMVDALAARVGADSVVRAAKDKHAAMHKLADDIGIPTKSFCFVGDADRDVPAFACVGLSLAPADASEYARASANRVLQSKGGSGAVAEAVDIVLRTRGDEKNAGEQRQLLVRIAEESIDAHRRLLDESLPLLLQIVHVFTRAIRSGNKILFCGNGGSAADAQHVAGELVGRFLLESEPWPAMALTTDSSILTAIGNDWKFEDIFARQVRAFGRPGDVVVGISTSGESANVLRALEVAGRIGAVRVGFSGADAGRLGKVSDVCFAAPGRSTPRVQELHILAWHAICELVERSLTQDAA